MKIPLNKIENFCSIVLRKKYKGQPYSFKGNVERDEEGILYIRRKNKYGGTEGYKLNKKYWDFWDNIEEK